MRAAIENEADTAKALFLQPRFACGDQARLAVGTGAEVGMALGTGYARFSDAAIPWTIKHDEVILVIEGASTIETRDLKLVLGPRDSVWLPKGAELAYRSSSALVLDAIRSSDWAESEG